MTHQDLIFIIVSIVFIQVAIYAAVAFYRHWLTYKELKKRLFILESPQEPVLPPSGFSPSSSKTSWSGFRDFRVQRKVFEDLNKSVCSFYLTPLDGKELSCFNPGQYLTFQFQINHQTLIRCYSLSDSPNPNYYRITVKKIPSPPDQPEVLPGLSSNYLHEQVQEGTLLSVKAPAGHFYVEDSFKGPIVLIAGGIGITPLLCILNTCLQREPEREVWLYYGVRHGLEHLMKEHLEGLAKNHKNFHLYICYSQARQEDIQSVDYQHAGHIDITLLRLTLLFKPYHFYICGPKLMMESIVPGLRDWGVPEDHIHYEAFGPASLTRPVSKEVSTAIPIMVTFSQSAKSFPWNTSANCLLDFAEEQGISIPSGCRAGHCGTCQTPLETGEVQYHRSPDLDLPSGTCLLCISTPKTDITLSA